MCTPPDTGSAKMSCGGVNQESVVPKRLTLRELTHRVTRLAGTLTHSDPRGESLARNLSWSTLEEVGKERPEGVTTVSPVEMGASGGDFSQDRNL